VDDERCSVCGFDGRTVSPSDAIVAIRSFPRRYTDVLARPDDDDLPDDPAKRRPAPGEWSALEHAALVPAVMNAIGDAVRAVEIHDRPDIVLPDESQPPPVSSVEQVLADLHAASDRLVEVLDSVPTADGWTRTGRMPGGDELSAIWLVRHAVHVGSHHLRLAEAAIRAVVGRPDGG
jgi:hypothetical protein